MKARAGQGREEKGREKETQWEKAKSVKKKRTPRKQNRYPPKVLLPVLGGSNVAPRFFFGAAWHRSGSQRLSSIVRRSQNACSRREGSK